MTKLFPKPKLFRDYTDEQIAKMGDDNFNKLVIKEAKNLLDGYDPENYHWQSEAPQDGLCQLCYRWGRYTPNQRHFGYVWKRICDLECTCEHHLTEIWIA